MLRLRFLVKGFSSSFSGIPTQRSIEKTRMDIKFANAQNLDSFLNAIDLSKTSYSMLIHTLKIVDEHEQKLTLEASSQQSKIRKEILSNLEKLDPQALVDFCELITNPDQTYKEKYWIIEQKKILINLINKHIISHSFDRKQILSLFEMLIPRGFWIKELNDEIKKIMDHKLTLEEISKILTGCGRMIYSSRITIFSSCMKWILQLDKESLDGRYLAKILDALAIKMPKSVISELSDFLEFIEDTLPRWKDNDLLSIIKLYKVNNNVNYWGTYNSVLKQLNILLNNSQSIEFIIELASLFKSEPKYNIVDEIMSKSLQIIKEKLSRESIDFKNLKKLLDFIGPNIDHQTALIVADKINNKDFYPDESIEILQRASWLCVNKEGKLFPLTDLISKEINYNRIQDLRYVFKIHILCSIIHTKNYELHGLQKLKEFLIYDLKGWITSGDNNYKYFIYELKNKGNYSSKLWKALAPFQSSVFSCLKKFSMEKRSLTNSILFYESDPEKWKDFVIENKNEFSSEDILKTIRFYQGPFEAIIFLLETYKNKLSVIWIAEAIERILEVNNIQILNDFARILNKMDPYYLINSFTIYAKIKAFDYLFTYSDYSLLSDLFAGAFNLLKDLPIHDVFNNKNIKILYFATLLGKLEPEMADSIISNCEYMYKVDIWSMLTISSKCTDVKLRENIIKKVFNEQLNIEFLRLALYRYWCHPETRDIDNYIIDILKKIVPSSGKNSALFMILTISKLSQLNINNHLELYNAILTLAKTVILENYWKLKFRELEGLLNLIHKNLLMDLDFAQIIWKSQIYNIDKGGSHSREKLIEKIKTVGLSDKKAVVAICNKQESFSLNYLAETISCLAELRFEKEKWAIQMANELIDYVENKKLSFENDKEHINWIYGLVVFNANKSIIKRHIENSKFFDCELPTFKHLLLENHFSMDPDYKEVGILSKETQKYYQDFDYFEHFGINKQLISFIESSFNKANLEVKAGTFIDRIWMPFYIPNTKFALWPVTKSILLYQSNKARGEFLMYRNQILRKVKDLRILSEEETNEIGKIDLKQFLNI